MPDQAPCRVSIKIESSNHHLALLKVLSYCKSKEILINFPLFIELLYEKRSTLTPCNRRQSYNSIWCHPWETLLICGCYERHFTNTLCCALTKAYHIRGLIAPDMPWPITHLWLLICFHLLKCLRLLVLEVICCRTSQTFGCLYPKPWGPCIEYELMRFKITSKVNSREDLNVKEVWEILLENPLWLFYLVLVI